MKGRFVPTALAVLAAVASPLPSAARVPVPPAPPADAELLERSKALAEEGKYAEAEKLLAGATSPAARWGRAVIASRQGRYAEAAATLRAIATEVGGKLDGRDPDGWILLAAAWNAPPEALAAHARGFHLSTLRRCEEAKNALEEALRLAPRLNDARYHLGYCLSKLGDEAGAERQLRTAIAGYARSERVLQASAQYTLGILLASRGSAAAKEAVGLLRAAAAPDGQGRQPRILVALGGACAGADDAAGARATYAEVLERLERGEDPDFPGELARQVRDHLSFVGCARRPSGAAEGIAPRCASAAALEKVQRAQKALDEGKAAEVEAAARAATKLEPAYGHAWFLLGRALLDLDRPADAEAAFRKARVNDPWLDARLAVGATALLAHALILRGSTTAEAVRLADEAATAGRVPGDAGKAAWHELLVGRAFAAAGNRACALEHLRAAEGEQGAPEPLRAQARAILAQVEARPADRDDCFEYQLYDPSTLAMAWRRYRTEHPLEKLDLEIGRRYELHKMERLRVRLRFTGARRPLQQPIARMLAEFAGSPIGAAVTWKQLGRDYRGEAEIEENGTRRWIAVPDGLAEALAKELPSGGDADAYLVFFGAVDDAPLLFLTEFDATAHGPG